MADAPSPKEIAAFLRRGVPIAEAMQLDFVELGPERVRARAPFAPNANHHGSVFGGSISALGIVTGWALVDALCKRADVPVDLVIHRSETEFLAPALGDLEATTTETAPGESDRFLKILRRFGRAQLSVEVELESDGKTVARHRGDYVGLRPKD